MKLNKYILFVAGFIITSVYAQNSCWTNSTGSIGNSSIFTCNSGTSISTADTLFVRHAVTIGTSNNQKIDYSNYDFSIISLENNATLTPYGANNELTLPQFAEINVNTGSSIVQPNNQSQGTAINIPGISSIICVWGTKCCTGNQSIIGPSLLRYTSPCNFSVPLPVSILNFNGIQNNLTTVLNWKVSKEQDFNHYEILKSTDGIDFIRIGIVYSETSESQIKTYLFEDKSSNSGNTFYKLKLVDNNGHFEFSSTIVVKNINVNLNHIANVFPNPNNGILSIEFGSLSPIGSIQINIIDVTGKIVFNEKNLILDNNVLVLNTENIDNGVYLLNITDEFGFVSLNRFTKN